MEEHTFLSDEGLNISITAGLWIVLFPEDADNKNDVIRLANQAMYLFKKSSHNNIAVANMHLLLPGK